MNIERRNFKLTELRVVESSDVDGLPDLVGHAIVFDQWSEDLGGFRERVAPLALNRTLQTGDAFALKNHNSDMVLGRVRAGTLALTLDASGLGHVVKTPDTTYGRDLVESARRGDLTQCSFGFFVPQGGDAWAMGTDGILERTLNDMELVEISLGVAFPAYPQTDMGLRSMVEAARSALLASDQPPTPADQDDDPGQLAQAIDQALDNALEFHANGDDAQGWALVVAAAASVDALLAANGQPDLDEVPQGRDLGVLRRRLQIAEREVL